MFPDIGPLSGGTSITINGKGLDIGRERIVRIDNKTCAVNARRFDSNHFNYFSPCFCLSNCFFFQLRSGDRQHLSQIN